MTEQKPSKEGYLHVRPGWVVEGDIMELDVTFYFI